MELTFHFARASVEAGNEFQLGDAEDLPAGDASFDVC
jgi:ubiquinone/menaquinone biosynthesis C-methylase UbiE